MLAALPYGVETWNVYCVLADRLQSTRSVMGISRMDKISNDKVLKRAGLPSLKANLIQMNLR